MRVAFLTCAALADGHPDDRPLARAARAQGLEVEFVGWRGTVGWEGWDAVVVRTPWDYQHHTSDFLSTLRSIEAAGIPLHPPVSVVEWNLDKRYLVDFAEAGLPVVATRLATVESVPELEALASDTGWGEIVVKPRVGASGEDTWRLRVGRDAATWSEACSVLAGRAVIVQPFLPSILIEGELSLVVLDGEPSHLLRKLPVGGEFRSQEEHGGRVEAVEDEEFHRWALDLLARLPRTHDLLVVRVDGLRDRSGRWVLGELEVIEPQLYLRTSPGSAEGFAARLAARLRRDRTHSPHDPEPPA